MKVRDVLLKFHKIIPFPWTHRAIEKKGYIPKDFILKVIGELEESEDFEEKIKTSKTLQKIIECKEVIRNEKTRSS